ncbi:PREDICTED: polyadenylate-binding protein 4-like [Tarenaya hassleriana]|uniref:polyadenylate-binding protein 4-like n=1 Tax=Tarenaya hassleriana TaxID=28532 RepID=UPI00053C629B|nr:PREDICTED: polyadenylate-binding protein 4-like [Tarenaya hassleriana]
MRDGDGKSKCFGFVNFENPEDAAQCVEGRKSSVKKEGYAGKALKKSERELELKGRCEHGLRETGNKFEGLNLLCVALAKDRDLLPSQTLEKLLELSRGLRLVHWMTTT